METEIQSTNYSGIMSKEEILYWIRVLCEEDEDEGDAEENITKGVST